MKHDLGVKKSDTPLQSRHFPAAEQNLNQRLGLLSKIMLIVRCFRSSLNY